jgi:GNAT superfamily N-acetyltransferase
MFFGIRPLQSEHEAAVLDIYQRAFAGPPWHELLTTEAVESRWHTYVTKTGFCCLVALLDGGVVGSIWWDRPSLSELGDERGFPLELFARKNMGGRALVWEREVITDPEHQKLGIASQLRQAMIVEIARYGGALMLTRMRKDNPPILKIAVRLGFRPTNIEVGSRKWSGVIHQYWYKIVKPLQAE